MYRCPSCERKSLEYDPGTGRAWCLFVLDCKFEATVASRSDFLTLARNGRRPSKPPARRARERRATRTLPAHSQASNT